MSADSSRRLALELLLSIAEPEATDCESFPVPRSEPLIRKARKTASRSVGAPPSAKSHPPLAAKTNAKRPLRKRAAAGAKSQDANGNGEAQIRAANLDAFEDDALPADELEVAVVEDDAEESDLNIEEFSSGSAECIDDPVRMYLMQMGEIPLLTRAEELAAPERSSRRRTRFRHNMLASDFVLQGAVDLLEKVRDGTLRLDRTIEVSVTNTAEKKRIICRAGPEPGDARQAAAARTSATSAWPSTSRYPKQQRREAWRRLVRRRKAVRLVEELGLRTQRLQPLLEKLAEIASRMEAIRAPVGRRLAANHVPSSRHELRSELRYLMRITLESPATLDRRVDRTADLQAVRTMPPSAISRPATCGWWSPSPSAIAIAA